MLLLYEKLSKIYYKENSNYEKEYEKRFNGYGTVVLPLTIEPLKCNEEFTLFYVNHNNLIMSHEKILKNSFEIKEISNKLPEVAVEQYVVAKLIEEAISTNRIEGIHSTRAEMKEALDSDEQKKKVKFKSLVRSYYNLNVGNIEKVSKVEDIRKIYDNLVSEEIKGDDEQLDGELFRKEGVDVKTATQRIIHKGVHPEIKLKRNLQEMLNYLNNHETPMIYKIAVSHYYFGYIHPFYDGNGRTSRYLSSVYLSYELDHLTAMTLSYATGKLSQYYYDAFDETNGPLNRGEITTFCSTFFDIILNAQETIIMDLMEKEQKLKQLKEIIVAEGDSFKDDEKDVLYVIGQSYIYGLEDEGVSRTQLMKAYRMKDHKINRILKKLTENEKIKRLKNNPVMVTLSESFAEKIK